ncbi:MAG: nitrogenase molybdenum-iron protein subunit beta, partial [Deltaproteobacteria bacterium]|jgi:nitrogenase molybdenum-iron protein beta chain|nr:nitrogenase molybdenum-iron protein subunit beta [Deltaproteobacteria bacterium]
MFPDQSGVMDAPMTGEYRMFPEGGTSIDDIQSLGGAAQVLALGRFATEEAAEELRKKCGVQYSALPLPIGVAATDAFAMALSKIAGQDMPKQLEEERGRLIDLMLDANPYYYNKKVAIFGDPDTVIGLTSFALELGMQPSCIITGTPGDSFTQQVEAILKEYNVTDSLVKAGADLFELHQWIKNKPVDLLLGSSYGKQIAKAEDIPVVRVGFPILDRYGHSYMPTLGYTGALRLAEQIADTLMDRIDRDCADEDLDVVM